MGREERETAIQYWLGEITEVQYHWRINQNGWDREKLDAYVEQLRSAPVRLMAAIVLILFGIGCVVASFAFAL